MIEGNVRIGFEMGLHARPAAHFVQRASRYVSSVWLDKDGQRVNAKSILGILMLAAERDSVVRLSVDGEDEGQAFEVLSSLLSEGKLE